MSQTVEENAWVFISHSNKDFEQVRVIRNKLERRNYRPLLFYLKCLENKQELEDLIKREIDARERFILCKSKNIDGSDWVKKEMDYIIKTGRPYVVIDLDASTKAIDSCIKLFDQRSTTYLFSTEDDVVGELKVLLVGKDFKVNTFKESLSSDVSMMTKGAYFIILAYRNLKKDEVEQLNQLVKRFHLNAVAYKFFGSPIPPPTSSSQSFVLEYKIDDPVDNHDNYDGWNNLDKKIIKEDRSKGIEDSRVAESIVNDLMGWDKRLYCEANECKKPIEQSRNANDLLKKLKKYVKDHPATVGLPLSIKKSEHESYLKCGWGKIWEDYFRYLDEPDFMALLNVHAHIKGQSFASIYACTDIEILTWVLEDLVSNSSPQAVTANNVKGYVRGVPASSVRHFIEHLLSVNGICL